MFLQAFRKEFAESVEFSSRSTRLNFNNLAVNESRSSGRNGFSAIEGRLAFARLPT